MEYPTFLNAGNAGLFTLDGTRSYLVGSRRIAIVDPGPDVESHVRALVVATRDAESVAVVVTHRHGDHAGAARTVADELGADVYGPAAVPSVDRPLEDGHRVPTDEGELVAVHTPGHTEEHLSYWWPARRALFVGDLMLGRGDTTWVAEYPGCVADYLASLARLRSLDVDVLYPAHGPAMQDVPDAIDRYETHRWARIEQVRTALVEHPDADVQDLLRVVYGHAIASSMRGPAEMSLKALQDYVEAHPA